MSDRAGKIEWLGNEENFAEASVTAFCCQNSQCMRQFLCHHTPTEKKEDT